MNVDALAGHLARLREKGALALGGIARRDLVRLQSLLDAGVLAEVRQGAGRRLVLHDTQALEAFIRTLYPGGLSGSETGELPPRSLAVAQRRDAKKAARGVAETVLLRGFGKAVLQAGDEILPLADWTRQSGAAALLLDDRSTVWGCGGTLAVVENHEVFVHFERLGLGADIALYAGGRLSGRVLHWLASPALAACALVHCGDYDPVGLDEYLRLSGACPGRTRLYLPAGLEELFACYGKRELLAKSEAILRRLRKNPDPAVRVVVTLMDRYGAGLEQEALLIG